MREKLQKFRELVDSNPELLGSGGIFGGLGQDHKMIQHFADYVSAQTSSQQLDISPNTVNAQGFLSYLELNEKLPESDFQALKSKIEGLIANGKINDDIQNLKSHSFSNLALSLNELGVLTNGKNPQAEYERALSDALTAGEKKAGGISSSNNRGAQNVSSPKTSSLDSSSQTANSEPKDESKFHSPFASSTGNESDIQKDDQAETTAEKDRKLKDNSPTGGISINETKKSSKERKKESTGTGNEDTTELGKTPAYPTRKEGGQAKLESSGEEDSVGQKPVPGIGNVDGLNLPKAQTDEETQIPQGQVNPAMLADGFAPKKEGKGAQAMVPEKAERRINFMPVSGSSQGLRSSANINRTSGFKANEDPNIELPMMAGRKPQSSNRRVQRKKKSKTMKRFVVGGSVASLGSMGSAIFASAGKATASSFLYAESLIEIIKNLIV